MIRGWNNRGSVRLVEKIKNCRISMARWKRKNRVHANERIVDLQRHLDFVQFAGEAPYKLRDIRKKLNQAYIDEENFWRIKSRNKWLNAGDRITRFFHAQSKTR